MSGSEGEKIVFKKKTKKSLRSRVKAESSDDSDPETNQIG